MERRGKITCGDIWEENILLLVGIEGPMPYIIRIVTLRYCRFVLYCSTSQLHMNGHTEDVQKHTSGYQGDLNWCWRLKFLTCLQVFCLFGPPRGYSFDGYFHKFSIPVYERVKIKCCGGPIKGWNHSEPLFVINAEKPDSFAIQRKTHLLALSLH